MCKSQTVIHMFHIIKSFDLIVFFLPALFSASPSLSIILYYSFCLVSQDGGVAALCSRDVKSASLLLKSCPFLPSSLTSFVTHPPFSPSSLFQPRPLHPSLFTFCPLPSLLHSVFSFFLQLQRFHPAVSSSLFPLLWSPVSPSLLLVNPAFTFCLSHSLLLFLPPS